MPAKKRTPENVWQLTFDIFYLEISLRKAAELNNFSRTVAQLALKDAVNYGYISEERYLEYVRSAPVRGYYAMRKNFDTEDELKEHYSSMGMKSAGNGLERLTEQASKGGLSTQAKHGKKVAKNLKNAKHYGSSSCKYGGIWFASKGERITALLLKSYGLIESIIEGENFQKEFGRFCVDFYINDKLIVEYHPIPKQKFNDPRFEVYTSINSYVKDRAEVLKHEFNGKIVAIPAPSGAFSATEFYKRLEDLGIKDTWTGFLEKCREVRKDIDFAEKQYELELKNIKPEEVPPF